ncbi:MAG TPA: response regulator [Opitutaceae bacterium]|nr:response regulator [Opitutaceae bacterium]
MSIVKKILIAHGDAKVRRRLVLLFADAGFDLRAFATAESAAENARGEWYDLAIIDHELSGSPGFTFVDALKKIQPTVPILLLVSKLELPLVVQGIRLGVADVLAAHEEPRVLLRRVRTLLRLEEAEPEGVTPEDLAQVESMLENLSGGGGSAHPLGAHTHEPGAELLRLSKEKAVLEARVERLQHEKDALEAELKTLLAQNTDAGRLQAEVAELRSERELAAAAQCAIDEKARALSETRAAIAHERSALEDERRSLGAAAPAAGQPEGAEREEIIAWRQRLAAEEDRLAEEAARFREESTRFAQERRRWHEDLDLFRAQEENLRAYEDRLRKIQSQLEADRVHWFSQSTRPAAPSPLTDDAGLKEAWGKLQRATELLEAERTNFRDDRLALQEHHTAVKRREEQVRDREIQLSLREKKLSELPPPPPPSAMKNLTRAPMEMARAVFGAAKKD